MAFWSKTNKTQPEAQVLPPLPLWDKAKLITKDRARDPNLPLGWYLYQEDQLWYGMVPKGDQTGHIWSQPEHEPKDLEQFLGTQVPDIPKPEPAEKKLTLAEVTALAIQEKKRLWETGSQLPNEPKPDPIRKRNQRLYVRMNQGEYKALQKALKDTGMTQQTYILEAIKYYRNQNFQEQLIESIRGLSLEISCQVKLLQGLLRNNPQKMLEDPDDWDLVLNVIRDREDLKHRIMKLMEVTNGHR